MFKKNNKVLPDIISLSTSFEYVECYVVKCKTKLQTWKIKQFVQPQYSAFTKQICMSYVHLKRLYVNDDIINSYVNLYYWWSANISVQE